MMKKSSKAQALVLPFLPDEIITDILTRLPVKTLIRFRSVSKSWLNLISNPNFINTHLLKSSKTNNFARQKIILWHVDSAHKDYLESCSIGSLFSPPSDNAHSLQLDYQWNEIVGSCNGLLCILMGGGGAFVIWNPSTGESKKLSILENDISLSPYAFGYDQLNDDYKVVQMEFDSSSRKKVVKLYSLRTNSWKKISDFPNSGASSYRNEFVNGALHWQVWNSGRNFTPFVIVSLDLGNETYGEIAQPDYGSENCSSSLIVVEGCISLYYKFTGRADIWVMKEYGLRDSWVKLYTISYTQVPKVPMGNGYVKYLSSNSMTGEILLKCDEMLLIYHTKNGTFKSTRIHDMFSPYQDATTYVESLVSPSLESKDSGGASCSGAQ